jgi:hypothetical protein
MKIVLKKWAKGDLRRIYINGGAFLAPSSSTANDVPKIFPPRDGRNMSRADLDRMVDWVWEAVAVAGITGSTTYFDDLWAALPDRLEAEI